MHGGRCARGAGISAASLVAARAPEFYITNFKTMRQQTEYTDRISRGDFGIGSFSPPTVRRRA